MIHDQFCRCRGCKPPLPSREELRNAECLARLKVALIVAALAVAALYVWSFTR